MCPSNWTILDNRREILRKLDRARELVEEVKDSRYLTNDQRLKLRLFYGRMNSVTHDFHETWESR